MKLCNKKRTSYGWVVALIVAFVPQLRKEPAAATDDHEQLADTRAALVIMNTKSRHLIMYDNSTWLMAKINYALND